MPMLLEVVKNLPLQNQIIAGVLVGLLALFLGRFLVPGLVTLYRLGRLQAKLRRSRGDGVDALAAHFANDKRLDHLWHEFRETLHKQQEFNSSTGELVTTALRSTV